MKPMLLKIKGINSFIEEQTIDFNELTQGGIFGIFGPTGSGKSTILDGITLALYGKLSRNSTNYINLNEQKGSVVFEFIISGAKHQTYQVSREFVRNKNGGINQGKCQLLELSSESPQVLADRSTEVSRCCEEIIGLSLTDFTRTVVLPQGKFSDFLKLEGKPRREMLERLFNLSKYGDDLTNRVKAEKIKATEVLHRLEGRLNGYEDVSKKALEEKKSEYQTIQKNLKVQENGLKVIIRELSEAEKLWALQQELTAALEEAKDLTHKELEIKEKENQLDQGKKAQSVIASIESGERLAREIRDLEEKLTINKDSRRNLLTDKDVAEEDWIKIEDEKNNDLPKIREKLSRIMEAISFKKEETALELEINELISIYNGCDEKNQCLEKEKQGFAEKINAKKTKLAEDEIKEKKLRVSVAYREKVNQGAGFTEKIKTQEDDIKRSRDRIDKNGLKIEKLIQECNHLIEKKNSLEMSIQDYSDKLLSHTKSLPCTPEELQKLRDESVKVLNLWEKQKSFKERINNQTLKINELKEKIDLKNTVRESLLRECEQLKKELTALQNKNLGAKFREQLIKGEACPVCGSKEHPFEEQIPGAAETGRIKGLGKNQLLKENALTALISEISELTGSLKAETNNQLAQKNELDTLGETVKDETPDSLIKQHRTLNQASEIWEEQKKAWEGLKNNCDHDLLSLTGDIKEKNAELKFFENQTKEIELENQLTKEALKRVRVDLEKLSKDTTIIDFTGENFRIIEMDIDRNELAVSLEKLRKALEEDQIKGNGISEKIIELNGQMREAQTVGNEKKKQRIEKQNAIVAKVGQGQEMSKLWNLQKTSKDDIKRISTDWVDLKEKLVKLQSAFGKVQEIVISQEAILRTLHVQDNNAEQNLKQQLDSLGFKNCQAVKEVVLTPAVMANLQSFIKDYYEALSKNNGILEDLNKKVNGRQLSVEKLAALKIDFQAVTENVDGLKKQENQQDAEVKNLEIRLKELSEFLTEKEKIDHRIALIVDLEKLFSGKKFVEFVAVARLKYISIEASKRLTEISNGNYGLEADGEGRFIIRDYKNGGASRDPSTLSGGETFLASLALALALSAEIQLKGRAPLEFFFLDEGFGSLHEDALEVVMNSIEMLHHEKLKVGIISHVESIKNRMPVKLLITPAEAGAGGSRIRIEK
ncbi:MAG: SMC family ATPase [Eubacteriaceae bacterium]|nr:SMC family ATPase [Eubacteriaceae bacterium]